MEDDAQKLSIETDTIHIEIEHDFNWFSLGIICLVLWAPCWWFEREIRCALGNQKVCAEMSLIPAKAPTNGGAP